NGSRFVLAEKTKTTASDPPESAYKKSGRAISPRAARKVRDVGEIGRCCWRDCALVRELLLAQTKTVDNLAIPIRVTTVEIIQKTAALVNHHDQPASRCMVLEVRLQMRGQVVDSLAQ